MKERPINLSAWEVRAILAGRKTQLRRMIALTSHGGFLISVREPERWPYRDPNFDLAREESDRELRVRCPFGAPGDRLWGKETWQYAPTQYCRCPQPSEACPCDDWQRGTGCKSDRSTAVYAADGGNAPHWRPSVHMPRWASRITLEVEQVRVQRVQEISREDAYAEGIEVDGGDDVTRNRTTIENFAALWNAFHGPGAFDRNDWVWALTFRRPR